MANINWRYSTNSGNLDQAAKRTRALLKVAQGTKACPTLEDVHISLKHCLEAAADPQYADQDFFCGQGFWVYVNRQASPWPTFEVLVTATPNYYMRLDKD